MKFVKRKAEAYFRTRIGRLIQASRTDPPMQIHKYHLTRSERITESSLTDAVDYVMDLKEGVHREVPHRR